MLVGELIKKLKAELSAVTDCPDFEAEELVESVLGLNKTEIILNRAEVSEAFQKKLNSALEKRKSGYPLQYIIGEWDFFGRSYFVGEGVLIPRSDTEPLCEVAIDFSKEKENLRILDLCSGSGCVAVTLALETSASEVVALEKSDEAFSFLERNVRRNEAKVTLVKGDILSDEFDFEPFDIIVSNPPYLTKSDMKNLQKEVTFEPELALFGDDDGLLFYKTITEKFKGLLKENGLLAFEIGINQFDEVKDILLSNGFKNIHYKPDINGVKRVIYSTKF